MRSPGRVPWEVVSDSPTSIPLRRRVSSASRMSAAIAGEVGLVDQLTQRVGDLGGPHRVGVDLGGVVKIT